MGTSFIGQLNLPRGLRNNNPGNIRPNPKYKWNGETGAENAYCIFVDIEHGIRAMGKDLTSKINRGLNTLAKYIPVYAPPADNNPTDSYIQIVSQLTDFAPNQILIPNADTLFSLVKAHIHVEVGTKYCYLITDKMIHDGIALI